METITVMKNFYGMPPPPAEAITKREELVRDIIEKMGHKYRLSRPMPRVNN